VYRIRQLAAKYGLTRTSLLHYDAIGLLSPSARTEAGYRLYGEEDEKRLQDILLFRSMGISLDGIKKLLEHNSESRLANALMIRLNELNREIGELRRQQENIIGLFKEVTIFERVLSHGNQDQIGRILLNGIRPLEWHERFESISPDLHQEFLKLLDLVPEGIKESVRTSLSSLPEEERNRLNKIIFKK
jgi:MerR family transcriptional regulator, thiopeptide resistance regulator